MYIPLCVCLYTCNNLIHAIRTDPTSFSEYLLCGLNKLFYNELIYCRSRQYYSFPCLPPLRSSSSLTIIARGTFQFYLLYFI